jgi:hypothetical protein
VITKFAANGPFLVAKPPHCLEHSIVYGFDLGPVCTSIDTVADITKNLQQLQTTPFSAQEPSRGAFS